MNSQRLPVKGRKIRKLHCITDGCTLQPRYSRRNKEKN